MLGLTISFDLPVNATTARLEGATAKDSCAKILKGEDVALFGTGKTGRQRSSRKRREDPETASSHQHTNKQPIN